LSETSGDEEIARKGWDMFSERIRNSSIPPLNVPMKINQCVSFRREEMGAGGCNGGRGMSSSLVEDTVLAKVGKQSRNIKSDSIVLWTPWRISAAAAAIAILVVASYFTGYITRDRTSVTAYHTLIAPAGQYAQLTLSDGSEIWLNSCSKIIYPEKFTSKIREIQLEGEGLFKVASDRKKPFVVKTGGIDIVATGTQFNVSAYPTDHWIATTLIEGIVKLQSDAGNSGYELKPGQIAVYDKQERRITAKNIDTDMQISWIHGEYRFEKTSLEDIAKRIERYFNMTIVFEDESLKQREFTGTFNKSQSIENILRVIETSTRMQYRISDQIIYIK
jgi:ferric-dicitrate binding protein FerR (iron transport regulator)